jgi:hypothetical protein
MTEPIKLLFPDKYITDILPDNNIKITESIALVNGDSWGILEFDTEEEWLEAKRQCEELGIDIVGVGD